MTNLNRSTPLWLFDLDNTLHDASHRIFPAICANMNAYIARVLHAGGHASDAAAVDAARELYWRRYGATLLGMVKHHDVRASDFLHQTHLLADLGAMLDAERGLGPLLQRLPGHKVLLTNAPRSYAGDVLRHLTLERHFPHRVPIEQMQVHRQLRPKPSRLMLLRLLRRLNVRASRAILVDDTLANLRAAKSLGLRTVWVTQYLGSASGARSPRIRPAYVDVKVKSVKQLARRLRRLG